MVLWYRKFEQYLPDLVHLALGFTIGMWKLAWCLICWHNFWNKRHFSATSIIPE